MDFLASDEGSGVEDADLEKPQVGDEPPADVESVGGEGELLLETPQADPVPIRASGLCEGRGESNDQVPVCCD